MGSSLDRVREPHAELEELKARARELEGKLATHERELAEALEQQTATSEVLSVISNSPIDVQSVLGAIAESAARLLDVTDAQIMRVEGDALQAVAKHGPTPNWMGLSESLEQQTATSEVLQVISSSPGELEPVFQTLLTNAVRVIGSNFGTMYLREGRDQQGPA